MPLMIMARSRVQMPSFTLVLTSEHGYLHGQSAIIEGDPPMLPTAPAHLMKTIDLCEASGDNRYDYEIKSADIDLQTIVEGESPTVFYSTQKEDNVVKLHMSSIIQKFNLLMRNKRYFRR
ncbi:hypothetical protein BYT27DRAFT_7261540 [Phlegmacium glaucopus]|nr:hypothetical protein BYT27DRAFT_7261540 [Phlegmacium glaucopus]